MKKRNSRKGFTLIELIVVIAILAILAAVAVPNFVGLTNKANEAVLNTAAAQYANAITIYNVLNDTNITELNAAAVTSLDTAGLKPNSNVADADVPTKLASLIEIGTDGYAKLK